MARSLRSPLAAAVMAVSAIGALTAFRPATVGPPARVSGGAGELADPAAVPVAGDRIQVYTTNSDLYGWKHIPTWTADPGVPGAMAAVADALPVLRPGCSTTRWTRSRSRSCGRPRSASWPGGT